jgi:NAD(P)H-dependent FMN reductase
VGREETNMNLLAINGSPRKGKATDRLIDKAVEGAGARHPDCLAKKINLADHDIQYCLNCLACRDAVTGEPYVKCAIDDDMSGIYDDLVESDALILGTPVHSGYPTALMMAFLERITWTFAKPEKRYLTISGCPLPRSVKERQAIIIVTSGIIPPMYRYFCDWATKCLKDILRYSVNAKTVGDLYAGDIEHRGAEFYFDKAKELGKKLF